MTSARGVSRRDFLRLRPSPRGNVLEVSCRALFMRLADATMDPGLPTEHEPWMGEPVLQIDRPSPVSIIDGLEADLLDVHVLRLLEGEWLEGIHDRARIEALLTRFTTRGGIVERD